MSSVQYIKQVFSRFLRCERGATALEYGLIMALIFLVILGSYTLVADAVTSNMQTVSTAVTGAGS